MVKSLKSIWKLRYCQLRYFQQCSKVLAQHQSAMPKTKSKHLPNEITQKTASNITLLNDLLSEERKPPVVQLTKSKGITVKHIKKETENSAILRYCLEQEPTSEGFVNAVEIFKNKNKNRQGHIEFIATGMKFIEAYGLEKNVEVYNAILDVFPRNRFDNRSLFDAIWPKPHPQINLALDVLTKMEWQGIMPTDETFDIVHSIFGRASFPVQKIYRLWFWFEEFKDLNPYRLHDDVYKDRIKILEAVTERLYEDTSGFKILELSEPVENTTSSMVDYQHFLISSQTERQQKYVSLCLAEQTLYVEGPIHIWINHKMEKYFVLKSGRNGFLSDGIHVIDEDEQKEGVVLAMCFATKPYKQAIQTWWQYLQETNPLLQNFNVVFNISDDTIDETHQQLEQPSPR